MMKPRESDDRKPAEVSCDPAEPARTIFTIGHSNHPLEVFLRLLEQHGVTALVDVRSAPFSRFNPHFNRDRLSAALGDCGIRYVHLGRELGGRPDDRSCYENGRVRYDRLARTECFLDGLHHVEHDLEGYRIALMCAERDPLHCHRTLLVGRELEERGTGIAHILADGRIETHADAMKRLLAELRMEPDSDLFRQDTHPGELVSEAIARQTERVGHINRKFAG